MREMLTAVVTTNSCNQLRSRQLACWVYDSALAVNPVRFNAIEPRTFRRQLTNDDSHTTFPFCLSVMSTNPVSHFAADMPRGIVPNQKQCFLTLLLQLLNYPRQKSYGYRRNGPPLDKPQPYLFSVCSQQPITSNCLRIDLCFLGTPLLKPQPFTICPAMQSGLGQSRPPDFIDIAKHPVFVSLSQANQPVARLFFAHTLDQGW